MRSSTATAARERARPLLGTIVRIRVSEATGDADAAIDAAFAEIATVHDLMSYQEATSDLSAIARTEAGGVAMLDDRTRECLSLALDWARKTSGVFDPVSATGAHASWRDLSVDGLCARVARPLRVDLSGIAKGYAVDRAVMLLRDFGATRAVIDAGGDLCVIGDGQEEIALRPSHRAEPAIVLLAAGALASSDPALARVQEGAVRHVDGRDGRALPDHFVAVTAPTCADADALTKIVLALGEEATPLLRMAGATAYRHDGRGWSVFGAAA